MDVEEIVLRNQVIDTLVELFIATDEKDWDRVKAVFVDEVYFDMTSMGADTPAKLSPQQIVDSWDEGLKPIQHLHHQVSNFVVDVHNGAAKASCYGIASHYLENPTGENVRTFVGTYDFTLELVQEEWKIDLFRFNLKYIDGNTNLEESTN